MSHSIFQQNATKILAEAVRFELTSPCGLPHFECGPLWPLRYASVKMLSLIIILIDEIKVNCFIAFGLSIFWSIDNIELGKRIKWTERKRIAAVVYILRGRLRLSTGTRRRLRQQISFLIIYQQKILFYRVCDISCRRPRFLIQLNYFLPQEH